MCKTHCFIVMTKNLNALTDLDMIDSLMLNMKGEGDKR